MNTSLTIKQKLLAAAIFILTLLAILAYRSVSFIGETHNLNQAVSFVAKTQADMLMLRRNEKDFLMRDSLKYYDRFNENVGVLRETAKNLNYYLGL